MATTAVPRSGRDARNSDDGRVVITDARLGRSDDIDRRIRRYLVTMGIRTACFLSMFFVPGLWKIVCVLGAGVLPGIAVVLANAADNRSLPVARPHDEPTHTLPVLGTGPVIPGEVDDQHPAA